MNFSPPVEKKVNLRRSSTRDNFSKAKPPQPCRGRQAKPCWTDRTLVAKTAVGLRHLYFQLG